MGYFYAGEDAYIYMCVYICLYVSKYVFLYANVRVYDCV